MIYGMGEVCVLIIAKLSSKIYFSWGVRHKCRLLNGWRIWKRHQRKIQSKNQSRYISLLLSYICTNMTNDHLVPRKYVITNKQFRIVETKVRHYDIQNNICSRLMVGRWKTHITFLAVIAALYAIMPFGLSVGQSIATSFKKCSTVITYSDRSVLQ